MISYFSYFFSLSNSIAGECPASFEYTLENAWKTNASKFPCELGIATLTWTFFMCAMSFYGLVMVGLGSIGNYEGCKRWYLPLIGLCVVFSISLWPFALTDQFTKSTYLSYIAFLIAMITCTYHLSGALGMLLPSALLDKYAFLQRWLGGSAGRAELQIKTAAARKLNTMAKHALDMSAGESQSGDLMLSSNYNVRLCVKISSRLLDFHQFNPSLTLSSLVIPYSKP